MENKIKTLVVGCGGMSHAWIKVAQDESDLIVVGLVDIKKEAAEQIAQQYSIDNSAVFTDLDQALKKTKPHLVFDCTVPEAHYQVTMKALDAGCHVMGEKPLADTMEHAREMVQKARDSGKLYAVMQNRRFLPTAPAMAKFVNSGVIGDIKTANVDFYLGPHFKGFRARMRHPLLHDMAIHTFDQARQFTRSEPLSVYCKAFNPKGSWYDGKASAMCIFEMSKNIIFNYRGSWCAEGYNTPWAGSWRIIGTEGTAIWEEDRPCAQVVDSRGEEHFHKIRDVESQADPLEVTGHEACILDFLRCLREGGTPETVCWDNIKSLAMVFGAIESDAAGKPKRIA